MFPMGLQGHIRNPQRSPVSTSVSTWGNFSPLYLSPKAWFDASNDASITSSSNLVSQWNDLSGNDLHVSQATSSAQPTTGTTTQNGRNVLVFSGNQYIENNVDTGVSVARVSVYVVWKEVTRVGNDGVVGFHRAGGNDVNDAGSFHLETTYTNSTYAWFQRNSGAITYGSTKPAPWGVYVAIFRNSGISDGWLDGVRITNTTTSNTSYASANGGILIGGRYISGAVQTGNRLTGQIGEIIVYPVEHTDQQRMAIQTYLRTKWGTP